MLEIVAETASKTTRWNSRQEWQYMLYFNPKTNHKRVKYQQDMSSNAWAATQEEQQGSYRKTF